MSDVNPFEFGEVDENFLDRNMFDKIKELVDNGPFEELSPLLDLMLGRYPESSVLWFWRGYAYYFQEPRHSYDSIGEWEPLVRFEEIESAFDRAIDLDPTNCSAVIFLCHFYWREARRQVSVQPLPELGFESAEALQDYIETADEFPEDILWHLYRNFSREAVDYSMARRVWETARPNLDMSWDATDYWFTFKSQFDDKRRLVLSHYGGWVRLLQEIAVDVIGEDDATWIVASAASNKIGMRLVARNERLSVLQWALKEGFADQDYLHLCKMYLLSAQTEGTSSATEHDRNIDFEITDLEEVVDHFERRDSEDATQTNHNELIRSRFATHLLDWVSRTSESYGMPAVLRLAERGMKYVLTGEYGETDAAFRLLGFVGQQQLVIGELPKAARSLSRAFEYLRTEEIALDLASALHRLDQDEAAIDVLKRVRALSHRGRQIITLLTEMREGRHQSARPGQSDERISAKLDVLLQGVDSLALSLHEIGRQVSGFGDRVDQLITTFGATAVSEADVNEVVSQVVNQVGWAELIVRKLGPVVKDAPQWFLDEVVAAEALYNACKRLDKPDFSVIVFVWGRLAERALKEGLLIPFGKWLDERSYNETVAFGKRSDQASVDLDTLMNAYGTNSWSQGFARHNSGEQLLFAAIDDEAHLFAEYVRTEKATVVKGRWLKREELPTRLRELRLARNQAAHPLGTARQGPLTVDDAVRFHDVMWKHSLLRDFCILLSTRPHE